MPGRHRGEVGEARGLEIGTQCDRAHVDRRTRRDLHPGTDDVALHGALALEESRTGAVHAVAPAMALALIRSRRDIPSLMTRPSSVGRGEFVVVAERSATARAVLMGHRRRPERGSALHQQARRRCRHVPWRGKLKGVLRRGGRGRPADQFQHGQPGHVTLREHHQDDVEPFMVDGRAATSRRDQALLVYACDGHAERAISGRRSRAWSSSAIGRGNGRTRRRTRSTGAATSVK